MNDPRDPPQSSSHQFGFLTKIKYGGPLGKITAVAASFFITLCVLAAAAWHNLYLIGGIALTAFLGFVFVVLQMKAVFLAHPKMATLEGTEVIEYLEIELRSRQHEAITASGVHLPPAELDRTSRASDEHFSKERVDE